MSNLFSKLKKWSGNQRSSRDRAMQLAYDSWIAASSFRNWDGAVALAEQAIAVDPTYSEGYRMLGFALLQSGSPEQARSACVEGLKIAPDDGPLHQSMGDLELKVGNYAVAEREYRRAMQFRHDDPELLLSLGLVLGPQERLPEAVVYLEQALRLAPDDVRIYAALGEFRYRLGQNDEAMGLLNETIVRKPDLGQAHFYLGLAFIRKGKWEEGLAELHRAVDLDPNDTAYRDMLVNLTARFQDEDLRSDEAE